MICYEKSIRYDTYIILKIENFLVNEIMLTNYFCFEKEIFILKR